MPGHGPRGGGRGMHRDMQFTEWRLAAADLSAVKRRRLPTLFTYAPSPSALFSSPFDGRGWMRGLGERGNARGCPVALGGCGVAP